VTDDERLMETGRLAEIGLAASTLVHELRQPVFAIKAMAQVVAEQVDGQVSAPHVQALIRQVEVLEELLTRYGDSSRRPTGASAPVNLAEIVQSGVGVVVGHRSGIEIQVNLPDAPCWYRVDPIALQQITSNLVRNAVDAATRLVQVDIQGHTIVVEDDGPGIRPDIEERLCEPFVTSKPPGEGTGLGLAVTQSLAMSIGAQISWETGPTGTRFMVELANGQEEDG